MLGCHITHNCKEAYVNYHETEEAIKKLYICKQCGRVIKTEIWRREYL